MGACMPQKKQFVKNIQPHHNNQVTKPQISEQQYKTSFGLQEKNQTLIFRHAPLRNSDFLRQKFHDSEGTPEEISLGFMLTRVQRPNRKLQLFFIRSTKMKIWVVFGGIERVSQTGLTVEVSHFQRLEQLQLGFSESVLQNKEEQWQIRLGSKFEDQNILVILEPFIEMNQTIFMIYRYKLRVDTKRYELITQSLQWCSLAFRISDVYGSQHLFKCGNQNQVCSICLERKSECILLPCRHMCLCVECTDRVQKTMPRCPLCRKQYYSVITYKSKES